MRTYQGADPTTRQRLRRRKFEQVAYPLHYCLHVSGLDTKASTEPHILIACQPKTASTFLVNLIVNCAQNYHDGSFVPAYGDREQLCDEIAIRKATFTFGRVVTHQHVPKSQHLIALTTKYNIQPVILRRNVLDCMVSLHDHIDREGIDGFLLQHITQAEWLALSSEDRYRLLSEYALPWYVNFVASWFDEFSNPEVFPALTYSQVTRDPERLADVLASAGLKLRVTDLTHHLDSFNNEEVRFNQGVSGRGLEMAGKYSFLHTRIEQLCEARPASQRRQFEKLLLVE
jgi:hypothetical protein